MEGYKFNMVEIVRNYIVAILDDIPGIKAVIMDNDTTNAVSLACPKSLLLAKEAFLIEHIDTLPPKSFNYLKGIFILRATEENKEKLLRMLKVPQFSEYHLFFTNLSYSMSAETMLQQLAAADFKKVVKTVQETYADFCPISKEMVSLNIPSVMPLYKPKGNWTVIENVLSNRIVESLLSVLLATRKCPLIRYQRTSEICSHLAKCLSNKIMKEAELFEGACHCEDVPVLLLLDRREDPITPLLSQWTYQAMIHELIGVNLNRVNIDKFGAIKHASEYNELLQYLEL